MARIYRVQAANRAWLGGTFTGVRLDNCVYCIVRDNAFAQSAGDPKGREEVGFEMKVVILAAGIGSRFVEVTVVKP